MESLRALGNIVIHTHFANCFNESSMKSGDRVFVQNGRYELTAPLKIENQGIQIIGLGESVEIHCKVEHHGEDNDFVDVLTLTWKASVLVEHISFTFETNIYYVTNGIKVSGESTLWMNDCELLGYDFGVFVLDNSNAHFKSSRFSGRVEAISIACPRDIINIIGCEFAEHIPRSCCIRTTSPIKCIGNIFHSNLCAIDCYKEIEETLIIAAIMESTVERNVCHHILDLAGYWLNVW